MDLKLAEYTVSRKTIQGALEALGNHRFSDDWDYNNHDIIEAEENLRRELLEQEGGSDEA